MKRSTLFYGLFIAALLVVVVGLPAVMRTSTPANSGMIEGLVSPGPLSAAHHTFAGQCTTCHTPLKGVETKTCLSCHAGQDFGGKQSTQFHATVTECTSCHVEHDGGRSLSRMNHPALLDSKLWRPPASIPAAARNAGTASLDCASCHSMRDPHQGLFGETCASCHSVASWRVEGYRHPSVNSTQCAECHKPPPSHQMMHFSMVSQRVAGEKARVDQCSACHTTDSFNNIRKRGWYDHH